MAAVNERTKHPTKIAALLVAPLLAACGQQGPLYLPDEARDIVTRPVQTPPQPPAPDDARQAPNTPQTVDSPAGTPPAPEVTAPEPEADKTKKNGDTSPRR